MPRRKKRWWKPQINTQTSQSILALFLILLGGLFFLTTLAHFAGVPNTLHDFATQLFGYTFMLLPIVFTLVGLSLTKLKHPIAEPRLAWGGLLLLVSTTTLLSVFSLKSGGELGILIVQNLSPVVTQIGVFLTSFILIIIAFVLMLNRPFNKLIEDLQKITQTVRHSYQKFVQPYLPVLSFKTQSIPTDSQPTPAPESLTTAPKPSTGLEIVEENIHHTRKASNSDQTTTSSAQLNYQPPALSLLADAQELAADQENIQKNANTIEHTLQNFGIQARIAEVNVGPAVTQFAIELAEGTKTSKITNLQNELALALASPTGSVRIEVPIPGKRLIGIEVPNASLSIVTLKSILQSEAMLNQPSKLLVALGQNVSGRPVVANIEKWPHVLVAGQTGAGKSALLHSFITSILFRAQPEEVSLILIDPKRVELTNYNGIPHLQTEVIVDADQTVQTFKSVTREMEKRYQLFQQLSARNLADFNQKTDTSPLPYIVIVVDELADLMSYAANEMETHITRIAQKARATGIHMILATQRPSVSVITGLIKANIPTRIALNVTSGTDSRVIIDTVGAEKLLGRGDMLYLPSDAGRPIRIQGVFLKDDEIHRVVDFLKQFPSPYQNPPVDSKSSPTKEYPAALGYQSIDRRNQEASLIDQPDDDKFNEAVQIILNHDKASASLLQRRLKVGYARAARLLDELEEKGLVGEKDGSNPRDVDREAAHNYLEKLPTSPDSRLL